MISINPSLVQYYPLGDSAIVIQFGEGVNPLINTQIRAVTAWLDEYTFEGFVEYVPAFTTITVYYEPWILDYKELLSLMKEMIADIGEIQEPDESGIIEIPVLYGAEQGPDLQYVADFHQISTAELISVHSQAVYLVYMIGFVPGFPYLGGLDERIATPRKDVPRSVVPAGSVGIAGQQTGVYPIETPGGWQIIGRTPLNLFDPDRAAPALLKAGDRVRFKAIDQTTFIEIKGAKHGH
ncbi:5-oxoprolinase subunit PxpB [Pedobacter nutrimenti]|jgi:inhibitor of KinA|uniref:Inhibitor of KinA n=1 Tax=Pedobacter nutrimenti TaxID=1241337 RepID=A0A318UD41_9SPHI|nr:5-oxoprolinase subunit PxpB [Pedobacter nutrimenti]PYF74003.1 inhibitor of KinA [Pedobacter nutrimenti]